MSIRLSSFQLAFAQPPRFVLSASAHSTSCRAGARLAPRRYYASNRTPRVSSTGKPKSKLGSHLKSPTNIAPHVRKPTGKYHEFEKAIPKTREIFKAPSHRGYIISCYAVGLFAYAYAAYNSYIHFVDPLGEVSRWIKYLFGGVCVVAGATGTVFLMRGRGLVSSITAQRMGNETRLHLTIRRPGPFMKPREVVISPKELSFSHELVAPDPEAADEAYRSVQAQLAAHKRIESTPFYKAPIAKTSFLMWKGFTSVRKVFTQEGFIYLTVPGGKSNELRLDTAGDVTPALELLSQAAFWHGRK